MRSFSGSKLLLTLAFAVTLGCSRGKRTKAEEAGDAFVDRYVNADQKGALSYAALGAASQLQSELSAVKDARDEGAIEIHPTWKRTGEDARGQRVVLVYEVVPGEKVSPRTLRLELSDLGEGPKVVLYELHEPR